MDDSRQFILDTAHRLFLQKSYKEVTLKELMEETGFSKGAFYHYFKSKQEIFEVILKEHYRSLVVVDFDSFSHESLRAFLDDYYQMIIRRKEQLSSTVKSMDLTTNHFLLMFEGIRISTGFFEMLGQELQQERSAWSKIIEVARSGGEIRSDVSVPDLAEVFICSSDGAAMHSIARGEQITIDKIRRMWNEVYRQIKM